MQEHRQLRPIIIKAMSAQSELAKLYLLMLLDATKYDLKLVARFGLSSIEYCRPLGTTKEARQKSIG